MHAHSLMEAASGAGPTVTAARSTPISTAEVNPLRAGRFGWIALAEAFGLDPRLGAHTYLPDTVYVTFSEGSEQRWVTLHIGTDLTLRRPVLLSWHQTSSIRGWVRVVIGYRAMAADADGIEYLDDALTGHGVTADVPVRVLTPGAQS